MTSNLVGEFKDITIEKVFKPVPSFDKAEIYYLPILLTDIPPKGWLEAFHSAYDSCQKYEGEQILPHHQIPAKRGLSADVSIGKRELTFKLLKDVPEPLKYDLDKFLLFQFSIEGRGPHPNTQESLKKSCEKANKEYLGHLSEEDKKGRQESQQRSLADGEQNRKNRRAEELTRGWFEKGE